MRISRSSTTIQTHNAVSLAGTSGASSSNWIDCSGFDRIATALLSDALVAGVSMQLVWSHDGVTQHGTDTTTVTSASTRWLVNETAVKARYVRLFAANTDASAHTVSAWVYLKT